MFMKYELFNKNCVFIVYVMCTAIFFFLPRARYLLYLMRLFIELIYTFPKQKTKILFKRSKKQSRKSRILPPVWQITRKPP